MPKRKVEARRAQLFSPRRVDIREPRQRFLIVCEGEKTEPLYFNAFRLPQCVVTAVGTGFNTTALVRRARDLWNENRIYDQCWCVFDLDDFAAEHFNQAIALAIREGIRVAYSNEAFELWYLLHFGYYSTGITREQYFEKLNEHLLKACGRVYEKNSPHMYNLLLDRQLTAIRNAERLLSEYDPPAPAKDKPSTTVHLLVQELNKYSK
jgi:hypothetical protein